MSCKDCDFNANKGISYSVKCVVKGACPYAEIKIAPKNIKQIKEILK